MPTNRLSRIFVTVLLIVTLGSPAAFALGPQHSGEDRPSFSVVDFVGQLWNRVEGLFRSDNATPEPVEARPTPKALVDLEPIAGQDGKDSLAGITRFASGLDPLGTRAH